MRTAKAFRILPALLALLIAAACSTTKRLADDETLYTGVKRLNITPFEKEKLPEAMVGDVKTAINVKPNNPMPFLSPYKRPKV